MADRADHVAQLVLAARAGDASAFTQLVHAFQDIAVAYATSILRDYHLAQDAAQEAFVDAHRALPALRDPAAFPVWFRTIVFKHCDRILRRKQLATSGLDAALAVASPDISPHERLEQRELEHHLRDAITRLSPAEQEVVLLYYMGDQSQRGIADFLGITPNAVKTRLYSARRRLRDHMSDIEKRLGAARPSGDNRFAAKVARLIQPDDLKHDHPWMWSPGIGTDVWAMFRACILGDLDAVRQLVERDPSLVRAHYEYRTPLSFAVRENHLHVAEYLIDHGALNVSLGDLREMARDRGHTEMLALLERRMAEQHGATGEGEPVAEAIRQRDLAEVRRLLDASPELLHAGDRTSNQPIHWAVMTRNLEMIDELLAHGTDLNARRGDGARPIHLTNGDYDYRGWRDVPRTVRTTPAEVYQHLVSRGAAVDMGMACYTGNIERVRELLAEDPSSANRVSEYNSYYIGCGAPLKNAVAGGHLGVVRLLLAHGADPNLPEEGIAPQGHALYTAVAGGHYEIAKLLLEHGAYPNPRVESSADAVWIAIRDGKRELLKLLGSYGAVWELPLELPFFGLSYKDVVATGVGRTMEVLAYFGDLDEIERRLTADPSLADDPKALSAAAGRGHEKIVRLLLRHQRDLAQRVTVSRPKKMALLLFEHGMDPNRPNWLRATPLHHFAKDGDVESAALFLDHGADLHARDEEYCSTPLAWAARNGQRRMVEFLLRRGAKVRHPEDPEWATPLAWATRRGHEDIVDVLTKAERTGALPTRKVADYDAIARDLVEVTRTGEGAALDRVLEHFRARRAATWDQPTPEVVMTRVRCFAWDRLGKQFIGDDAPPLELDDARELVARSEGYESWTGLVEQVPIRHA